MTSPPPPVAPDANTPPSDAPDREGPLFSGAALREIASGVGWTAAGRVGAQLIRFFQTLLLARFIAPEEFGLVGMLGVAFGLIGLFGELGIPTAVMQKRDLSHDQLSSLFWIGTGICFFSTLAGVAGAYGTAWFYSEPRLVLYGSVGALSFLISGPSMVPNGMLHRDLKFRALTTALFLTAVIRAGSAVGMAAYGYGVWAILVSTAVAGAAHSGLLLAYSGFRPSIRCRPREVSGSLRFGGAMTAVAFLDYGTRSLDTLVVGYLLGGHQLGLYMIAYNLVSYPETKLASLINTVMLPVYARLQDRPEAMAEATASLLEVVCLATFPMVFGLAAVAPEFVPTVLGPTWSEMVRPLELLCLAGPSLAACACLMTPVIASGRAEIGVRLATLKFFGALLLIPPGAHFFGIVGVAGAVVATGIASFVASVLAARQCFALPVQRSLWIVAVAGALAATMAGAVRTLGSVALQSETLALRLVFEVLAGVAIYVLLLALLRRERLREALRILQRARRPDTPVASE